MTPSALRLVLRLVAAAGIPGIIAGSIADSTAAALTFGGITAIAAFGLIVLTAGTTPRTAGDAEVDVIGAALEARVARLVAAGADEAEVRSLVGEAVRLGRHQRAD